MKSGAIRVGSIGILVAAMGLAGCSEMETSHQIRSDAGKAASLARVANAPAPFVDTSPVKIRKTVWIGANAVPMSHDHELPPKWRGRKVTLVEARTMDLREVADLLTSTTGMPVSYAGAERRRGNLSGAVQHRGQADLTSRRVAMAPGAPVPAGFNPRATEALVRAQAGGGTAATVAGDSIPAGRMRVNFSGTLSQFLDLVAANFGLVWSSDGDRIIFSTTETKVFDVPALPIVLKLSNSFNAGLNTNSSAGVGASGSSGSSGGNNQDGVTSTSAFELWKDINSTVKTVVAGDGGVEVSGASGTVSVTARPETVARVASYIRELNRRLDKEVVLNLTVYSVVLDRTDNYTANLNMALQKAGAFGGSYATAGGASVFAGAASSIANQGLNLAVLPNTTAVGGSNVLVQALSSIGNVSTVNSQSLTTVNGIPVPFQDVNLRGYIGSVTTTALVAGSSSALSSLQPSSVKTGFSLNMTPHVNDDGTILLSYALDMSELAGAVNGFDTFSSGGQTVQLPNINSRNFVQEAIIPADSTLVLSGIELTRNSSSRSGVGSPDFPLFGGSRQGEAKREILVVAITPHLIDLGYGRVSQ